MKREELIETIKTDAFDPYGWMSDAQQANLEWIEDGHAIYFQGEGSIDVGHLVSLVLAVFNKAQDPTDDERDAANALAEYDRGQPSDYERAYADPLAEALRALLGHPAPGSV